MYVTLYLDIHEQMISGYCQLDKIFKLTWGKW